VKLRIAAIFVALFIGCGCSCALAQDTVTVFAAASMKNALDEIDSAFTKARGTKVVVSYAATSALAKQIDQGAPADVFISADVEWMNYVAEHRLIKEETRVNLLGNKLVLIAPKDSKIDPVTIDAKFDIAHMIGTGRIAVADPAAVPAGKYAKSALQSLGLWSIAEPKLAPAENVRAVLAYVSRGEAPVGIVYETDAKVEPNVKIIGKFPESSHPAIIYPVAVVAASKNPDVSHYIQFLRSPQAKAIFEHYGFSFLSKPIS
jgi:molybdate transport system substrate-binding protein